MKATWEGSGVSRRHAAAAASLCLAVLMAGCATGQISEVQKLQARASYERGVKAIEDGDGSGAMSAFREAVGLDPRNALYRDWLGLVWLQLLQRPDLAMDEFRRAVELDPGSADAHFHMGIALAEQQQWPEAIASYRRALGIPALRDPELVHQSLGLAFYHLKRYREAEEALRLALNLDPALGMAYYNLGLVFVAEGRKEEAKRVFQRAQEVAPDAALAEAARQQLRGLGEGVFP